MRSKAYGRSLRLDGASISSYTGPPCGETENLVLLLLRDIRKEQADQRSVLLSAVDHMRRLEVDVRDMERRLDARISAVRDDLELMLKSELLGRLTHFETLIDEKLEKALGPNILARSQSSRPAPEVDRESNWRSRYDRKIIHKAQKTDAEAPAEKTCRPSQLCHTRPVQRERKDGCMSLQNHLSELERRHSSLEREIEKELVHPATDDTRLTEMKRRKLHLKDEIAKLRGDQVLH